MPCSTFAPPHLIAAYDHLKDYWEIDRKERLFGITGEIRPIGEAGPILVCFGVGEVEFMHSALKAVGDTIKH